jgi:hypothetical protein
LTGEREREPSSFLLTEAGRNGCILVDVAQGRLVLVQNGSVRWLMLDAVTSPSSRLQRLMRAISWCLVKVASSTFARRGTSLSLFLAVAFLYGQTAPLPCSTAPMSPKDFADISTMLPGAMRLCAWRYARDAYDMLLLGLRLGENPRVVITTTPKPIDILIGTGENGRMLGLLNDPGCVITRGSSYENRANLSPTFFSRNNTLRLMRLRHTDGASGGCG